MRITYLFDPLCGWCYGAGLALETIRGMADVTLTLAPTGLFADENGREMDAGFAAFAWRNDQRIAQLTGQPFSDLYRDQILGARGGRFDSGPMTLGLVAVGQEDPAGEVTALKALHHARYVDGRDTALPAVVADVLTETGFIEAAKRIEQPDEALRTVYRARLKAARSEMAAFGINGVPAVVVGEGIERRLLPSGALFEDKTTLENHLLSA